MKVAFYGFLFLVSAFASFGQSDIITDRPTQSSSPYTLPKGYFQIETGFQLQNTNSFFGNFNPTERQLQVITFNTSLVRFGLSDNIELRLVQETTKTRVRSRAGGSIISASPVELTPTLFGAKIKLMEGEGLYPQVAFLAHIGGPILSDLTKGTQADFRFSFQHTLGEKSSIAYNLGGMWPGGFGEFTPLYTLVYNYSFSSKLSSFVELYGFLPSGAKDHRLDFGLTYLIQNMIQLDAFAGFGISRTSPDFVTGLGLSFMLPKK